MVWNHADRIKLLGIIQHRPWHWNRLDFYYTDNDFKENDFEDVAKLMEKSAEECQRNWRSMKVCYYRMLRNGKSGKSERTKELAKQSSFLKESFQLITTRPKRRAKSKTSKLKEKLIDSSNIIDKKEDASVDIETKDLSVSDPPNGHCSSPALNKLLLFTGETNVGHENFNIDPIKKNNHTKIKICSSNRRKATLNNIHGSNLKAKNSIETASICTDGILKQKLSDKNFHAFGQLTSKRLRTMHIDIARDTMHHIHNIIYEQQKYNRSINILNNS